MRRPLANLEFAIIDSKREHRTNIEKKINRLGGVVNTVIHCNLTAIISNRQDMQKNKNRLRYAKKYNVHVVSEEFLLDVVRTNDPIPSILIKRSLCEWGGDVSSLTVTIISRYETR